MEEMNNFLEFFFGCFGMIYSLFYSEFNSDMMNSLFEDEYVIDCLSKDNFLLMLFFDNAWLEITNIVMSIML